MAGLEQIVPHVGAELLLKRHFAVDLHMLNIPVARPSPMCATDFAQGTLGVGVPLCVMCAFKKSVSHIGDGPC